MRTTVTLDPDVDQLLRKAVRERDLSFKQAINDAIRVGLRVEKKPRRRFKQKTFDLGSPSFDVNKSLAMASDLEDEEIVGKLMVGR